MNYSQHFHTKLDKTIQQSWAYGLREIRGMRGRTPQKLAKTLIMKIEPMQIYVVGSPLFDDILDSHSPWAKEKEENKPQWSTCPFRNEARHLHKDPDPGVSTALATSAENPSEHAMHHAWIRLDDQWPTTLIASALPVLTVSEHINAALWNGPGHRLILDIGVEIFSSRGKQMSSRLKPDLKHGAIYSILIIRGSL